MHPERFNRAIVFSATGANLTLTCRLSYVKKLCFDRVYFKVCSANQAFFSMERETRRYIKDMTYFSSLGFQLALPIIGCYFIGNYLDNNVFHSSPWATLIFLALGIAAGFRNIALAIKKIRKY